MIDYDEKWFQKSIIYHLFSGLFLQTNLNNMVCPAISDPFHGPYYRMMAMSHQSIMVPLVGKLYAVFAQWFLSLWKLNNNENKKEN